MAKTRKDRGAPNRPRTALSDLKLDRVSLVPSGDDPMAHVVLAKSAPSMSNTDHSRTNTVSRRAGGNNVGKDDGREIITKDDLPDEVLEYIEALEDSLESTVEKNSRLAEVLKSNNIEPDNDDDILDAANDLEVDPDDAKTNGQQARGGKVGKKAGKAEPNATSKGDGSMDLSKSDPAVREVIEKMQADHREEIDKANKRAEDAENIAKAERTERLTREYVSKAQALPMIAEDPNELGAMLQEIAALDPAAAAKVEKVLKAANEAIEKGDLFSEIGRHGVESTVAPEVESAAAAIRKDDPNLTHEQAMAKAYEANPALYEQEMRESRSQGR
jgi:hypothetical protein